MTITIMLSARLTGRMQNKRSTASLNLQCFFSSINCSVKAKETNLPNYLPRGKKKDGFIPFMMGKMKCKQLHLKFKLWSLIQFPLMITILLYE